jgi:hypothetical protein
LNRHISCHHNQVFLLLDMGFHTHQSPTLTSFPTTTLLLLLFFFFTPPPKQWCILKFRMLSPPDDNHNKIQYTTPFQNPPWCCWPMDMEMYMDMPHTHTHTHTHIPFDLWRSYIALHPFTPLQHCSNLMDESFSLWPVLQQHAFAAERRVTYRQTDRTKWIYILDAP